MTIIIIILLHKYCEFCKCTILKLTLVLRTYVVQLLLFNCNLVREVGGLNIGRGLVLFSFSFQIHLHIRFITYTSKLISQYSCSSELKSQTLNHTQNVRYVQRSIDRLQTLNRGSRAVRSFCPIITSSSSEYMLLEATYIGLLQL